MINKNSNPLTFGLLAVILVWMGAYQARAQTIALDKVVSSLAGSNGSSGFVEGTAAKFSYPTSVVLDASGNVYVADNANNRIRKVTPAGVVSTLAGGTNPGLVNATGASAQFYNPTGIAIDATGANLYVADGGNNAIRKIVINTGVVTTFAGGTLGSANGTGTAAQFNNPSGIDVDASGNVYVADAGNNRIRKIVISSGVVTTLAGSGTGALVNGTGTAAQFYNPTGITVDASGNVYVADASNNAIRKIVISSGVVTTLAGSATAGFVDATGTAAQFSRPSGVALDASGNVFVADATNNRIRKIVSTTGVVTTIAGSGTTGGEYEGIGSVAQFNNPTDVTVDASGVIYVADQLNHLIRKIVTFTFNDFGATYGTASAEQYANVYGAGLTAAIVATASANYEASLTTGTGYAASVSFTPASATAATKVYVRLKAGISVASPSGSYLGTLTLTSSPATAQTLALSGYCDPADQTITFDSLAIKTMGDADFNLTASSSGTATTAQPLPITYTSSNAAVATVSGSTVHLVGAGNTTITAFQIGNTNYNPATAVQRVLKVIAATGKLPQSITFNPATLPAKVVGDAPFTLTATVTLTPVTFTSGTPAVATIAGNTVTIIGAGTTTITASQAGDATYNAASATQTLTVTTAPNGIEQLTVLESKIFPNPTADELYIQGSQLLTGDLTLSIYDMQGRMTYTSKVQVGEERYKADVSSLAPGVYCVSLSNNKEIIRKTLVKK